MKKLTFLCLFIIAFLQFNYSQNFNSGYKKNLFAFIEFRYDTIRQIWIPVTRCNFIHDKSGNLISESNLIWNKKRRNWDIQNFISFKYDEKKNITERAVKSKRNKSKILLPTLKTNFTYKNGLKKEEQNFDVSRKNAWIKTNINSFEYDSAGRLEKTISSIYKNKNFLACAYEFRSYNKWNEFQSIERSNHCTDKTNSDEKIVYEYNEDSSLNKQTIKVDSKNFSCTKYKYRNNKLFRKLQQLWVNEDSLWHDNSLELFVFNQYDDIIEKLQQTKRSIKADWSNERRTVYCYNADLKIQSEIIMQWNEKNSDWYIFFKREYLWTQGRK